MSYTTLFVISWVISMVISYGLTLGSFQNLSNVYGLSWQFRKRDVSLSLLTSVSGLLNIICVLVVFGLEKEKLKFRLTPIPYEKVNWGSHHRPEYRQKPNGL